MNREERIKQTFYDWDDEMDVLRDMQKCQRNWDYERTTKDGLWEEVVDYLLWTATHGPSKQHEGYFDVYYSYDRKVVEECTKYTWGTTHSRTPPSTWRNAQANAPLYILFVAKEPETQLNCHADGTLKSNKDVARWENAYVSIGIAIGLVMRAAQKLGYATGCNKSHGDINGNDYWEKRLGILEDVKQGKKKIAYGVGIGYPKEGLPRWESEDVELALGAGNGSNLTTENMETHPRTGNKMRKIKIVNIKEDAGKEIEDPYGNVHKIPEKAEIKINTQRNRYINVIEIK
tara:strand:+ start:3683 stop:4549 length:867 start_codon:yes stop_codon:yes gene_type:complete